MENLWLEWAVITWSRPVCSGERFVSLLAETGKKENWRLKESGPKQSLCSQKDGSGPGGVSWSCLHSTWCWPCCLYPSGGTGWWVPSLSCTKLHFRGILGTRHQAHKSHSHPEHVWRETKVPSSLGKSHFARFFSFQIISIKALGSTLSSFGIDFPGICVPPWSAGCSLLH